ncbi:hypothetical protein DFJ58DRAFT_733813 [Suillus subalutaceus]|uniref:uncharacterized protein n=1 Tax=Suillus subalutaceus TaxID=48586 RepID=UPI001B876632|nr:uncharacterized protein DFJ58DRAFT_733813 [Suillus subalutaceus]KAG1838439.1 hypothetical protein DFJ58DRAFT_733813 [Suillus subalutaceus]
MSPTPSLLPTQLSDSEDSFDACQLPEDDFNAHCANSMSPTPPLTMSASSSSSSIESMPIRRQSAPPSKTLHLAQAAPCIIPMHILIYDLAKPQRRWPHGMYTIDMAIGFQQMVITKLCGFYGQEQLFHLIFGDTPFVKTTYHDNHKAWRETELTILETHKQARRTEDGLWANYLAARCTALGLGSKKHSGRK